MAHPYGIELVTQRPAMPGEILVAASGTEPAAGSTVAGFDSATQPKQVQPAGWLGV